MAQKGTGATITFSSGFLAEILDVNWGEIERASIPSSHMGTTGGRTFLAGDTYDPGKLDVEIAFAPETTPPFLGAAETVTLTHVSAGTGGNSTWSASGFMQTFAFSAPWEERSTAQVGIKLSGNITVTP